MPKVDRKSTSSSMWDKYVGTSLEVIPLVYLCIKKIILQQYRVIQATYIEAGKLKLKLVRKKSKYQLRTKLLRRILYKKSFDVAPCNIYEQMKISINPKWRTDYDFYVNQQSYPQTMMIAGCDMHTTNLEERHAKCLEAEKGRKIKRK